jgi:signal transduction histidine kinase
MMTPERITRALQRHSFGKETNGMKNRQSRTKQQLLREIEQLQQRFARSESTRITGREAEKMAADEHRVLDRILEFYEQDRQLVGYEIHDGFTQQATGAMLHFQAFQEQMPSDPEKAWATFHTAMGLLKLSIEESRRLINALRPPLVEESGLKAAIERLIAETQFLNGPKVELCWETDLGELAPRLVHTVFRIVQECLTNARRHSKSSVAQIRLTRTGNQVIIEVKDWGVGFDPKSVEAGRIGLEGIRLRARLSGGRAMIVSEPGKGTCVSVELPTAQEEPSDCPLDQER